MTVWAPSRRSRQSGRNRRRPAEVLVTPRGARAGNLLYLWLNAYLGFRNGVDRYILSNEHSPPVTRLFQKLAHLTLDPHQITSRDNLKRLPEHHFQRFGTDFTRADLKSFAVDLLLNEGQLPGSDAGALLGSAWPDLTISVRRGDYYAVPQYRRQYGFDVAEYVGAAVEVAARGEALSHLLVVSDDPRWCRDELSRLLEQHDRVLFVGGMPLIDLMRLAMSKRLILSNSTYAYWGAYLSNALGESKPQQVIAPSFHHRSIHGGQAWQHDPEWISLEIDG